MAWVICDREITCKDDLRGLPSTEVWATLLYATWERNNAIYESDYYTLDLDYCRSVVRGKNLLDSDIYYAIYVDGNWADPEAGDGSGDFSGLAEIPFLRFPQIPEPAHGSPMADAAWAHIEQFKQTQYLAEVFDPTALNRIGHSSFGLSMTFPFRSVYDTAGAPSVSDLPGVLYAMRGVCERRKQTGYYAEYNSAYPGMPAALSEMTVSQNGSVSVKWHNNWCDFSAVKTRSVNADFYVKQTLTRSGAGYTPETDGTFQLKHVSGTAESSFNLHFGEAWADPVFPNAPAGYGSELAGYEYACRFAVVVKPEFQFS